LITDDNVRITAYYVTMNIEQYVIKTKEENEMYRKKKIMKNMNRMDFGTNKKISKFHSQEVL